MWRRPTLVLFLLSALAVSLPAVADQKDPRLEPLFTALKTAPTAEDAASIEERIWAIWGKSSDAAVDSLMQEGIGRLNAGEDEAALVVFDRVVGLAPDFAEGWNKRATTLFTLGRLEQSAQDIDKVLDLEPRHFGALSGLGLCDIRLGKAREALAAFRRAAAIDPNLGGVQMHIEVLKQWLIKDAI
jgi:tetratricopeptide (TPR) repeat protein